MPIVRSLINRQSESTLLSSSDLPAASAALVDPHCSVFQSLSDRLGLCLVHTAKLAEPKFLSIIGGHQLVSSSSLNLVLPSALITDTNIRKPKKWL